MLCLSRPTSSGGGVFIKGEGSCLSEGTKKKSSFSQKSYMPGICSVNTAVVYVVRCMYLQGGRGIAQRSHTRHHVGIENIRQGLGFSSEMK